MVWGRQGCRPFFISWPVRQSYIWSMLPDIETRLYRLLSSLDLRPTLERAAEIGRLLAEAKPSVPYGQWATWLKRFHLSRQSAADYVQVHTILEADPGVDRPAGQLGIKPFLEHWRRARKAAIEADRRAYIDGLPSAKRVPGLHCGDALRVMRRMADASVDVVITDPPFGIGLDYDGWVEPDTAEGYWEWFEPYWREMCRVVVPGGLVLVCQGQPHWRHFPEWFPDAEMNIRINVKLSKWYWSPLIVWHRPGAEPRITVWPGAMVGGAACDEAMLGMSTEHPAPMMLAFARLLVMRYSRQGDVVLDPFAGTGTLGVAARELERGYIGIERSRRYYTLAKRRLSQPASA